jgi:hypothetical protein
MHIICGLGEDKTVSVPNFVMSTSLRGGIEAMYIVAHDYFDDINGYADPSRNNTTCTTGIGT